MTIIEVNRAYRRTNGELATVLHKVGVETSPFEFVFVARHALSSGYPLELHDAHGRALSWETLIPRGEDVEANLHLPEPVKH